MVVCSQALKRLRERGDDHSDQKTAKRVKRALDSCEMAGYRNEAIIYDAEVTDNCELEAVEGVSRYHVKQREGPLQIRCWEFASIGGGTVHECVLPDGVHLASLIAERDPCNDSEETVEPALHWLRRAIV